MAIELVLADPRSGAREALRHIVEGWGWTVVAEARDAYEAVRIARELDPDVVLLDSSAGAAEGADIFDLSPSGSGPLVVCLIDRPQEHASGPGLRILKGVPGERMHELVVEALIDKRANSKARAPGPSSMMLST